MQTPSHTPAECPVDAVQPVAADRPPVITVDELAAGIAAAISRNPAKDCPDDSYRLATYRLAFLAGWLGNGRPGVADMIRSLYRELGQ